MWYQIGVCEHCEDIALSPHYRCLHVCVTVCNCKLMSLFYAVVYNSKNKLKTIKCAVNKEKHTDRLVDKQHESQTDIPTDRCRTCRQINNC